MNNYMPIYSTNTHTHTHTYTHTHMKTPYRSPGADDVIGKFSQTYKELV